MVLLSDASRVSKSGGLTKFETRVYVARGYHSAK